MKMAYCQFQPTPDTSFVNLAPKKQHVDLSEGMGNREFSSFLLNVMVRSLQETKKQASTCAVKSPAVDRPHAG